MHNHGSWLVKNSITTTTDVTIVGVPIDGHMIEEAERLAAEVPLLRHSIRKGEGTVYGFLGELVFLRIVGGLHENTYDYDVVMRSGVRVDVKTKMATSAPRPHYECSVAAANTKQGCDVYAFVRVMKDMTQGWYCGAMFKDLFFAEARPVKKGDLDESNGWVASADCFNVRIDALTY